MTVNPFAQQLPSTAPMTASAMSTSASLVGTGAHAHSAGVSAGSARTDVPMSAQSEDEVAQLRMVLASAERLAEIASSVGYGAFRDEEIAAEHAGLQQQAVERTIAAEKGRGGHAEHIAKMKAEKVASVTQKFHQAEQLVSELSAARVIDVQQTEQYVQGTRTALLAEFDE